MKEQYLSVVLVPLQPGHPLPLADQIMDQQAGKLYRLVKKEMAQEPAALNDLMARLDSLGLLPMEAQGEMELWPRISTIMENPELMAFLQFGVWNNELTETPGARELLETMTMYDWLTALEEKVEDE
jgi:hypothetical protein